MRQWYIHTYVCTFKAVGLVVSSKYMPALGQRIELIDDPYSNIDYLNGHYQIGSTEQWRYMQCWRVGSIKVYHFEPDDNSISLIDTGRWTHLLTSLPTPKPLDTIYTILQHRWNRWNVGIQCSPSE
jgi:hypothetical protein